MILSRGRSVNSTSLTATIQPMNTLRTRHGIASGSILAVVAILVAGGLIVLLSVNAGDSNTLPKAGPSGKTTQSQSQSSSPARPPASPVQAAAPSTPSIPDEQKPEASVRVKPATLQLGYVEPGESKTATYEIINESDVPLNLTAPKKGCSCTEILVTPGVIPPGGSREVTAIFTAGLTPTIKNSKVGVLFEKHRSVQVPMKAIVSRKVRAIPQDFRMHKDGSYGGPVSRDKGRIEVTSVDGRPFRVLSAGGQPAIAWPGSGGDPMLPSISHLVAVDLGDHDKETLLDPDGNKFEPFWVFETDHPEAPVVEVRILHKEHRPHRREKEREWVFVENRIVADAVDPGGSTSFEIPIIWNSRDNRTQQIHEVVSMSPDFKAALTGMRADGTKTKAKVTITPESHVEGPFQGTIEFVSREHRAPLTVIGYVNRPGSGSEEVVQ